MLSRGEDGSEEYSAHGLRPFELQDKYGRLVLSRGEDGSEEYLDGDGRKVQRFRSPSSPDIIQRVHVSGAVGKGLPSTTTRFV